MRLRNGGLQRKRRDLPPAWRRHDSSASDRVASCSTVCRATTFAAGCCACSSEGSAAFSGDRFADAAITPADVLIVETHISTPKKEAARDIVQVSWRRASLRPDRKGPDVRPFHR